MGQARDGDRSTDLYGYWLEQWHFSGDRCRKGFSYEVSSSSIEPLLIAMGPGGYLSIRVHPDHVNSALRDVEHAWSTLFPRFPLLYSFLDDIFDEQYKAEELVGSLLMVFALILLFIACLGLVGLVAFTTKNKAHEIGIRKVLGGRLPVLCCCLPENTCS